MQSTTPVCISATLSLSTRLTLALSGAALVIFAGVGVWQVQSEENDLRTATARDARLLGRSLEVAFENALRDRQGEDVQETLRELERSEPDVDVYVYDGAGGLVAASSGARPRSSPAAQPSARGRVTFVPEQDSRAIELTAPLFEGDGGEVGTLLIVRPLDSMRRDLTATKTRVVLSVLSFVVIIALLTMLLSRAWVARPLARMIEQMRRVRRGDLSPAMGPVPRDEVGRVLTEFDVLVGELREARARLDAEIEQRRRLEDGLRRLDKLVTVGQLAAGLAHEIGSPLQVLEGRLASLERSAARPEQTRRVARILRDQTQRITRIVSRLSEIARRRAPQLAPTDVSSSCRTVIDLVEGEARRRGIEIVLTAASDVPLISSDGDQVQQLVLNLVRNALEASEPHRERQVSVRITRTSGGDDARVVRGVRITVTDEGRGMETETLARAFEAFFTTRESEGGSGLGLAVVKGIVDEHRGSVAIHSEPGVGTRVDVDLPITPSDIQTAVRRAEDHEEGVSS